MHLNKAIFSLLAAGLGCGMKCKALTPQEVADALDTTGLTWEITGEGWSVPSLQDYLQFVKPASAATAPALQTTVTGPGIFRIRQDDGTVYSGEFSLWVDGHLLVRVGGDSERWYNGWHNVEVSLPPGLHVLRWQTKGMPDNAKFSLDAAGWNPGELLPAVEALAPGDATRAVWATVHLTERWTADTASSVDGAAARLNFVTYSGTPRLLRMVEGPARCRWQGTMNNTGTRADQLVVVEGPETYVERWLRLKPPPLWTDSSDLVPEGWHVLSWELLPDDNDTSAGTRADFRLDSFSISAATLSDALDTPGSVWRTGGTDGAHWSARTESLPAAHAGSAGPVHLAIGGTAWMETEVTGPAVVTFLSTDAAVGTLLELTMDGAPAALPAGARSFGDYYTWNTRTLDVPAGAHVVRITAQALAGSGGSGLLVDRFRIHPRDSGATLPRNAEAQSVFRLPGQWGESTVPAPSGGAALANVWPAQGDALFAEFTGPGLLSVMAKVDTATTQGYNLSYTLQASMDGLQNGTLPALSTDPAGGVWRSLSTWIPPGRHVAGWHVGEDSAPARDLTGFIRLADAAMDRRTALSLEAALDAPGLTWTATGTVWTTSAPPGTVDGVDAAVLAAGGALQSQVSGPALFSLSHQPGDLVFTVNGTAVTPSRIRSGAWDHSTANITGTGPQTLAITLRSGPPAAVDDVQINPAAPSFAEALDAPSLTWNGNGWQAVRSAQSADGVDAAVAATGDQSYLGTNVIGPGTLTFRWRSYVSSLSLKVDGIHRFSAGSEWSTVTLPLTPGFHRLSWQSSPSYSPGSSWLDQVTWDGGVPPSLEEGADSTGIVWSTAGAGWSTDSDTDALTWKPWGTNLPATEGWVEALITGPGVLVYKAKAQAILNITVNGTDAGTISVQADFETECIGLAAGPQRVRWRPSSTATGDAALDYFRLLTPQPLSAVDSPGAAWDTVDGPAWWAVSLPEPLADRCPANGWLLLPPPGGAGSLRVQLSGAGVLESCSTLTAQVNGASIGWWSKPYMSVHRESGEATITWPGRTAAVTLTSDSVAAAFQPQSPTPFHAAMGTASGLWIAGGTTRWIAEGNQISITEGWDASLHRQFSGPVSLTAKGTGASWFSLDNIGCTPNAGPFQFIAPTGHGEHTVSWYASSGPQALTAWSETTDPGPPLSDALESGPWRTGGSVPWRGAPAQAWDFCTFAALEDHALSGTPPPGGDSWLETDVTGPGELRFTARGADLRVAVDGAALWRGTTVQRSGGVLVSAGPHTVRFTTSTPARVLTAQFTAGLSADIAATLDSPGAELFATALDGWSIQSGTAHAGTTALRSGEAGSSFSMGLTGPVMASIQVRGASTSLPIFTARAASGAQLVVPTVSNAWREALLLSPTGAQAWTCTASDSTLLLDNLRLSAVVVPMDEALDFPGLAAVQTGGTWIGLAGAAGGTGGDCLAAVPAGTAPASVTATFTGPGSLTWRQWVSPSLAAAIKFYDNGILRSPTGTVTGWRTESVFLTAGPHTIRWEANLLATDASTAILDAVTWAPATTIPLADAVEAPPLLTLTTGGDTPWSGLQRSDAADASDLAISGTTAPGGVSWLELTPSAPAHFDFRCRITGTSGFGGASSDLVRFSIGGLEYRLLTPALGGVWQNMRAWLPAAGTALRCGWHPAGTLLYTDEAAFDMIAPATGMSLADALDAPHRPWLSGGNGNNWSVAATGAPDGTACASCQLSTTTADAWAATSVRGPALVRFYWNQGSSTGNRINVSVDGTVVRTIPPGPGWNPSDVPVPAGDHSVTWRAFRLTAGTASTIFLDRMASIPTGYGTWAAGRTFPSQLTRPGDDPDADGLSNLMEFATGSDPLRSSSSSILTPEVNAGSLTVALPLPEYDVTGLSWSLEYSDDLQSWQNAGPFNIEQRAGGPVLTAAMPATPATRYARLRVSLP